MSGKYGRGRPAKIRLVNPVRCQKCSGVGWKSVGVPSREDWEHPCQECDTEGVVESYDDEGVNSGNV